MKQHQSKELTSPFIAGLAILGKDITDMNQFCRNNLKPRLPKKLEPLTDNVSSESQWLFGDDFNKRISQINNMNSTLTQSFRFYQQNNGRYNNSSYSGVLIQEATEDDEKRPALPAELTSREKGSQAEQQQILQELKK